MALPFTALLSDIAGYIGGGGLIVDNDNKIEEILNRADMLESGYLKSIENNLMQQHPDSEWSERRQALYANGPILGMYREHDHLIMEYIDVSCCHTNKLEEKSDVEYLKSLIIWLIDSCEEEIRIRFEDVECDNGNEARLVALKHKKNISTANDLKELDNRFSLYNGEILRDLQYRSVKSRMLFLKVYIKYEQRLKERENYRKFSQSQVNIEQFYNELFGKKSEFKKYGLITIAENFELQIMDPVRVFDHNNNKTIILDIPIVFADVIDNMRKKGYIDKLSIRGTDELKDGFYNIEILLESIERGSAFTFDVFKSNIVERDMIADIVTKLYSKEYGNQLWVISEHENDFYNIYFEELDDNFNIFNDCVVTRMLHIMIRMQERILQHNKIGLEESKSSICPIIVHMDFEYIYYKDDEFCLRLDNPYVKGEGLKRKKIFKIDDCCIPFDYEVEVTTKNNSNKLVLFIYFVLCIFFKHKDLINEYFAELKTGL